MLALARPVCAQLPTGACAQTGLAKASMLIACLDEQEPLFEIIVRRSFADYVIRWLKNAARPGAVILTDAH